MPECCFFFFSFCLNMSDVYNICNCITHNSAVVYVGDKPSYNNYVLCGMLFLLQPFL